MGMPWRLAQRTVSCTSSVDPGHTTALLTSSSWSTTWKASCVLGCSRYQPSRSSRSLTCTCSAPSAALSSAMAASNCSRVVSGGSRTPLRRGRLGGSVRLDSVLSLMAAASPASRAGAPLYTWSRLGTGLVSGALSLVMAAEAAAEAASGRALATTEKGGRQITGSWQRPALLK